MKIKFKGKVRKVGNCFVVTVPKQYVDNGIVTEGTVEDFTVEVDKHANQS